MKNKTIMLVAALTTFAIIGIAGNANAYTPEQLQNGGNQSLHITKLFRIGNMVLDTCSSQVKVGDYTNLDACLKFTEAFDRHMTAMMNEVKGDVQAITDLDISGITG